MWSCLSWSSSYPRISASDLSVLFLSLVVHRSQQDKVPVVDSVGRLPHSLWAPNASRVHRGRFLEAAAFAQSVPMCALTA